MYEDYFTRRLHEALALADAVAQVDERSVHLRASGLYRDLLRSSGQRSSPRCPTRIPAILYGAGNHPRRIFVSNLSTCGFTTIIDGRVRPGRALTVEMDGFAPINAFAAWQQGEELGCKFVEEVHPAIVEAAVALSCQASVAPGDSSR